MKTMLWIAIFAVTLSACMLQRPMPAKNIFIGDSISRNWQSAAPSLPFFVNSGVAGDVSGATHKRFERDVLRLNPQFVHILVGTNDLTTGRATARAIDNIRDMAMRARKAGAIVVIGTVPPLDPKAFPRAAGNIGLFNALLKGMAEREGFPIADYFTAMAANDGSYRDELYIDGIHPNEAGYIVMNAVLAPILLLARSDKQFAAH